ncbi:MAG: hypothetical protein ACK5LC_10520 [Coprobacillaceae bacterium]
MQHLKKIVIVLICSLMIGCTADIKIQKNTNLKDKVVQYDVKEYIYQIQELQTYEIYKEAKAIWDDFVVPALQEEIPMSNSDADFDVSFNNAMIDDTYSSIYTMYGEALQFILYYQNKDNAIKKIRVVNYTSEDYTQLIANILADFKNFTEKESMKVQTRIFESLQQKNVYI